jgi:hypothetical protein
MKGCYSLFLIRFFYIPNSIAAMMVLLRRTLVRSEHYAAKQAFEFNF